MTYTHGTPKQLLTADSVQHHVLAALALAQQYQPRVVLKGGTLLRGC